VGAELEWVETDTRDPFTNEPRVLPCGQSAAWLAATGEQELTGLSTRLSEMAIDRLAGLFGQLEADRMSGLLLSYGGTVERVSIRPIAQEARLRRDIVDANRDQVAAAQLAVDCEIEQREIARTVLELQLGPDRPDVARPERRLGPDQLALVPRRATGDAAR
jgi:hypothetical protein